jgi:hypothetical protein
MTTFFNSGHNACKANSFLINIQDRKREETADRMLTHLSSAITTSAACLVISVPAKPIAIPTDAHLIAGASV